MQSATAGDVDLEFELCYFEVPETERRASRDSWPGLRPEEFLPVRGFRWARGQGHMLPLTHAGPVVVRERAVLTWGMSPGLSGIM